MHVLFLYAVFYTCSTIFRQLEHNVAQFYTHDAPCMSSLLTSHNVCSRHNCLLQNELNELIGWSKEVKQSFGVFVLSIKRINYARQ